jgi:hypothetical protein
LTASSATNNNVPKAAPVAWRQSSQWQFAIIFMSVSALKVMLPQRQFPLIFVMTDFRNLSLRKDTVIDAMLKGKLFKH